MNHGERDEIIFKLLLIYMRDNNIPLFGETIYSVGFLNNEYLEYPESVSLNNLKTLSDSELSQLAESVNIFKAPSGAKSDVYINNIGVSIKSLSAAPTALVNHTSRPGFEFACQQVGVEIDTLDEIIEKYWDLRFKGIIKEDTKIVDKNCPFAEYKEYLKPILEYFLFMGTGSKLSDTKASYILEFSNPIDISTCKKLCPSDAVDSVWEKLVFSLRAKKGMPKDYNPETYEEKGADSIKKWVKYHSGDYRGALHIRSTKK